MTKWGFNSRITFLKNLGKKCRETCISRLNQRNVILEESRFTCFSLKNIREIHNSRRESLNSRWLNYMILTLDWGLWIVNILFEHNSHLITITPPGSGKEGGEQSLVLWFVPGSHLKRSLAFVKLSKEGASKQTCQQTASSCFAVVGTKSVVCGLKCQWRKKLKKEENLLDCLSQVLLLQIERKTRGESSPRCGRVHLEEGQEVSISSLLDQVRLRRGGEATELTEGTRRRPFPNLFLRLVVLHPGQQPPLLFRASNDLSHLFEVCSREEFRLLTIAQLVQLVPRHQIIPRLLHHLRREWKRTRSFTWLWHNDVPPERSWLRLRERLWRSFL